LDLKKGVRVVEDKDQDSTDLEKCLHELKSSKNILILGGLQGNITQTLANLNSLYAFSNIIQPLMLCQENIGFILTPGKHEIHCKKKVKVGLIPLGVPVFPVTTHGLKWNLINSKLAFGELVSTSNEMTEDVAQVEVNQSILWICDFRK